jgi:hypothetical protein
MKISAFALLLAIVLSSTAAAHELILLPGTNILYVRGSGLKTVADERDKYEKRRNRLGSGIIILGAPRPIPPVPHKKR